MSAPAPIERVHLRIRGRVQGVSFRAYARDEARRLGLSGWVRNMPDGSVEAVAEGPRAVLDRFVAWCRTGSPQAAVEHVDARFSPPTGETATFEIRGLR